MTFDNVEVSTQMLQRFLSKCPQLVNLHFCLSAAGMPRKLPASLVHLKNLFLDVCMAEKNEISAVLCMIMSSPLLEKIYFLMWDNEKLPVQQTPTNFLDPENYSDLKLDHLETLQIENYSNLPLEMEFVKLIMDKSPVLKKVRLKHRLILSVDEELEILSHFRRHHLVLLEEMNF
ncbi:putative FBD domain-containing protein [Helianthus anomalus]